MSNNTIISAKDLSLTFQTNDGPVHALKDVSLDIKKGDFISFIGPSGCGKTTFLRVMADLEQPTAGSIKMNGVSPEEARRSRAYGYVFQAAGLYPWRTIGGNIRLPLEIMGYDKADQAERVKRVLELVELGGFEKKFPWQLSGGMQQRASIARALAFDADILLMDEPFGALDEIVRDHLNEQLLQLWDRTQKTIAFVTHSIPEAVYLSTKIVVMSPRPGRISDVIESTLPRERPLEIRDSPEFIEIAHRVREGLGQGTAMTDVVVREATRADLPALSEVVLAWEQRTPWMHSAYSAAEITGFIDDAFDEAGHSRLWRSCASLSRV